MVGKAERDAAAAREDAARARAEAEALRLAAAKPVEQKPVTRAELNVLVADGKITQDAADTLWERQVIQAAERKGEAAAERRVDEKQREGLVKRELVEYRELVPAAYETGSKERTKVEKEFKKLRDLGFPDNQVTEVAALRAAFGDPEVIRASRSAGGNGPGESHVEVGGGERPGGNGGNADGKPKGLTPREDAHYTNLIQRGVYKDWNAVAEERKHAKAKG